MKPTRNNSASPAAPGPAVRRTWVLGPLAIAVPLSFVLALAGAGSDWIGAVWLAAVLWAIAVSFVQALWSGLRHGDWSAFVYVEVPRNDEEFDFFTRNGPATRIVGIRPTTRRSCAKTTGFSSIGITASPVPHRPASRP